MCFNCLFYFKVDEEGTVKNAICECIAGITGHCKHISPVVFAVNSKRAESKTSEACGWEKPSASKLAKIKYTNITKDLKIFFLLIN